MIKWDKILTEEYLKEEYLVNGRSFFDIGKEKGCSPETVKHWCVLYSIQLRHNRSELKDLTGKRFNRLLVIDRSKNDRNNKPTWNCLCDCGKSIIVCGMSLNKGETQSCGCLHKDIISIGKVGEISQGYWTRVLKSAQNRKLKVEITKEYAWNLFLYQNKKCALTGRELFFSSDLTNKNLIQTASLDRIDSKKHYIEGNIQWVHKSINRLKRAMNNDDFIQICFLINDYYFGDDK